jgi:hypothetical protein
MVVDFLYFKIVRKKKNFFMKEYKINISHEAIF